MVCSTLPQHAELQSAAQGVLSAGIDSRGRRSTEVDNVGYDSHHPMTGRGVWAGVDEHSQLHDALWIIFVTPALKFPPLVDPGWEIPNLEENESDGFLKKKKRCYLHPSVLPGGFPGATTADSSP